MEISKMLTVSTANISQNTAKLLTEDAQNQTNGFQWLSIYEKAKYGWFIFIGDWDDDDEVSALYTPVPDDLKALATLAKNFECDWLCLDRDGEPFEGPGIQVYDWNEA